MSAQPRKAELVARRRADVLQLRADGLDVAAIASMVGVSVPTVRRDISAALKLAVVENVEELRAVELRHLMDLRRECLSVMGEVRPVSRYHYVDSLIRLSERMAKLMGLDAPGADPVAVSAIAGVWVKAGDLDG